MVSAEQTLINNAKGEMQRTFLEPVEVRTLHGALQIALHHNKFPVLTHYLPPSLVPSNNERAAHG